MTDNECLVYSVRMAENALRRACLNYAQLPARETLRHLALTLVHMQSRVKALQDSEAAPIDK